MASYIKKMIVYCDNSVSKESQELIRELIKPFESSAFISAPAEGHPSWTSNWEEDRLTFDYDAMEKPLERFTCFVTSHHLECSDVAYALHSFKIPTLSLKPGNRIHQLMKDPPKLLSDRSDPSASSEDGAIRTFFTFSPTLGRIFVVEGGDGSGKQTQTLMLLARLRAEGMKAERLDFPHDGTPGGKVIREILFQRYGKIEGIPPNAFASLYGFNRFEMRYLLNYWLVRGVNIILDRYMTANYGYQVRNLKEEDRLMTIRAMEKFETVFLQLPPAHRVVYLQLNPQAALKALFSDDYRRGLDAYELETMHFKQTIQDGFKWCCNAFPETWTLVPCYDRQDEDGTRYSRPELHEMLYSLWAPEFLR